MQCKKEGKDIKWQIKLFDPSISLLGTLRYVLGTAFWHPAYERIPELSDKATFTAYIFPENSISFTLQQITAISKYIFDSALPLDIIQSQFMPMTTS